MKRGPYGSYINDPNFKVPRSTLYYRKKRDVTRRDIDNEVTVAINNISTKLIPQTQQQVTFSFIIINPLLIFSYNSI